MKDVAIVLGVFLCLTHISTNLERTHHTSHYYFDRPVAFWLPLVHISLEQHAYAEPRGCQPAVAQPGLHILWRA